MEYLSKIKKLCDEIDREQIKQVIETLEDNRWQTIFVVGNGGSAATASHMVCDLSRKLFSVICLNDNIPLLTATSNDDGYVNCFATPLASLAKPKDVLIVITGSGNSKNIIEALVTAKTIGMTTIGFLGFDGGQAKDLVDKYILIPSNEYGLVEDFHLILNHLITEKC